MAEGLKIWQQNSFCVRDEPFVISLMNCRNDKPFTRTQQCLTTIWQLQSLRSLSGQRCWAGQSLSLLLQVAVVHCSSQHQSWKQEHLSLWSRYSCTGKSVPEKAPEWKHLKNRKPICLKCQNVAKAWTGGVWMDFGDKTTGCCYWEIKRRVSASAKRVWD